MMNRTREKEVWARVLAASAEAPAAERVQPAARQAVQPAQEGLREEQVLAMVRAEALSAHTYAALAGRARGGSRTALEQLAREERDHQKQLAAVYYLMTGRKPHVSRPQALHIADAAGTLRSQYEAHAKAGDRYRDLARETGPFAGTFRTLGSDEERHGQMVLRLLPGML